MKKKELITAVAKRTGLSKPVSRSVVEAVLNTIAKGIKRGPVHIAGFGTFRIRRRSARKGRNPRTGETIDIPESVFPVFIPGKQLKDSV